MSGRDWQWPLAEGETLLWQGRPAPRCYTFQHWRRAAAGTSLFLAGSFWLMLAYQLIQAGNSPWWLLLIPLPLVILSFLFGPVPLLLARIRWEKTFYALTDHRILVREGLFSARFESFPLSDVTDCQQKKFAVQLISLRLRFKQRRPLVMHCLEQPQNLLDLLTRGVNPPEPEGDSV